MYGKTQKWRTRKNMKKDNILTSLKYENGWYIATIYNIKNRWYEDQRFLYYTKKEIFSILRKKYNCIVSHDFY